MPPTPSSGAGGGEDRAARSEWRARRALRAQDAASLGTWDYDLRSNVVTWDAHAAALAGMDLEDFGGTVEAFLDVVHPDDRERVLTSLLASIADAAPFEVAYRVVRRDATVRSLLIRGKALRGRSGEVVRLIGACVDVTDVHRAGRELERTRHAGAAALLAALQRSLLTDPPQPDHIQVAVRYAAAADGARIGGDWYDALVTPDGALMIAIGDCVGHDQAAAVSMATMRNLLRATAYIVAKPPGAVLEHLETMMAGLEVDALATAILGRVEQPEALRVQGLRRLVWSNAGHLPPVLLQDGTAQLLVGPGSDLLLGVDPGSTRRDSDVLLRVGATVLLYTDGLVERRGEHLDTGMERLRGLLEELAAEPLETLCDELLERLLPPEGAEDDVALLALRLFDENQPRPVAAGARATPDPTEAGAVPLEQKSAPGP